MEYVMYQVGDERERIIANFQLFILPDKKNLWGGVVRLHNT